MNKLYGDIKAISVPFLIAVKLIKAINYVVSLIN
jgi:hypothetical protein